ncbi:MAG: UDP-2,4-diacetamido-2,4,6-trideoxy-beta-L-altropyranose hydrolase [Rhodospirillaceae bacterium]|nr:UDP-2,4-diacetamido-2,4,6-trideoxy-beta-L-altropyranose hydrolase [Rhodospirillales bacterium]
MMTTILIRADASASIGLGHAMRCLAIAEQLMLRGARVVFLMHQPLPQMVDKLSMAGATVRAAAHPAGSPDDAADVLAVAAVLGASCVIADSYAMNSGYFARLADDVRLVVLDDEAKVTPLPCHMVVNASPAAQSLPYDRIVPNALTLLGPRYALIRREFTDLRPHNGVADLDDRNSVVVTFGGSDPLGLAWPVASRLRDLLPEAVTVDLIVGAATPHGAAIAARGKDCPGLNVHLNPPTVASIFARAGMAVTAAGGTVNELAAMAVPMLTVVVASNQQMGAQSGDFPTVDARHDSHDEIVARSMALWRDLAGRKVLSQGAAARIDGQGGARVAEAILS